MQPQPSTSTPWPTTNCSASRPYSAAASWVSAAICCSAWRIFSLPAARTCSCSCRRRRMVMYLQDAGGNYFQWDDVQRLMGSNISVGVRVVVCRAPVVVSSRRLHACKNCEVETSESRPGGGSYLSPLKPGPDGSIAVCVLQQTIPCGEGNFVVTYELGLLDASNAFISIGTSQYAPSVIVQPGNCSFFGIRTVFNRIRSSFIDSNSNTSLQNNKPPKYLNVLEFDCVFSSIMLH